MNYSLSHLIATAVVFTAIGAFGYYAVSPLFHPLVSNQPVPGEEQAMKSDDAMAMKDKDDAMHKEETGTMITGTTAHPATGTVRIVKADGKNYVRYENLKTINGPDIHVYLSKGIDAREHIDLGKVTTTEGSANYLIPENINPADYAYVLIWCEQFGVLFNSAKIN